MSDPEDPPPVRGETRAIELLRMVGGHTPEVRPGFTRRVVTRARAQQAVAGPLRALGGLIAAVASALSSVVRSAGGERREP
jgi:hypothetical protein